LAGREREKTGGGGIKNEDGGLKMEDGMAKKNSRVDEG
jgi:hypothetical protein